MLVWLAQYWLQVLFGLILAALAWGGKKLISFYVKEFKNSVEEIEAKILTEMKTKDDKNQEKMEMFRLGLLSIQRRMFKERCHFLLDQNHEITVEELENITKDHDAYKKLGGNHEGDTLFELVIEKAKKDITT